MASREVGRYVDSSLAKFESRRFLERVLNVDLSKFEADRIDAGKNWCTCKSELGLIVILLTASDSTSLVCLLLVRAFHRVICFRMAHNHP
jgi:hypothetical protein